MPILLFFLTIVSSAVFAQDRSVQFYTHEGYPLKGELTFPQTLTQKTPAVVLIHGSGPADMDHWLPGNSAGLHSTTGAPVALFSQLKTALNQAGFIVLRYNKRGYGKFPDEIRFDESGNPLWANPISVTATYPNLLHDISSSLRFLRQQPEVNPDNIYLLGISEGTALAIDAAAQDRNVKGLILLSSVASNLKDSLFYQNVTKFLDLASGRVDANHDGYLEDRELAPLERAEFDFAPEISNSSVAVFDLDRSGRSSLAELEQFLTQRFNTMIQNMSTIDPFKDYYLNKFQTPPAYPWAIPLLNGPVLMIHGGIDVQCPLKEAQTLERHFLKNPQVLLSFKIFPEYGHGLSPNIGKNKLINTIGPIEDSVLDTIKEWAQRQIQGK